MWSIRLTSPNGSTRTVPLTAAFVSVGRAADNTIVLDGAGVSSHHCAFQLAGSSLTLSERGSTNGTFVNNRRVESAAAVQPGDRIYVGSYLVEVLDASPAPPPTMSGPSRMSAASPAAAMRPMGTGGAPILRAPSADRAWRDLHGRLARYAEAWEEQGRLDRLALSATELRQALRWLKAASPDANPPVQQLQRDFIAASQGAVGRRKIKLAAAVVGGAFLFAGLTATAILLWPDTEADSGISLPQPPAPEIKERRKEKVVDEPPPRRKDDDDRIAIKEEMEHVVIPIETYDDIANRYGVSKADLAEWSTINPDDPPTVGETLRIKKPKRRPLPQQRINYEVEKGETSWSKLSDRFAISVQRLRAYNPDRVKPPAVGDSIVVWIDPRPYKPRLPKQPIPAFEPNQSAVAIGHPNQGRLQDGVQMPDSKLYTRRQPRRQYGSGYMVANLQIAIANFRQDLDFDGELVLADISKPGGGLFHPHKSHQQGRDIDIWLPTLRGVFKSKYLSDTGDQDWGRRPNPEEADWFATWGLVKALGETGAVQKVFLDISLHDRVYNAAKLMGATDEELDELIQWPRKYPKSTNILQHSAHHVHHIHVRFNCAPWEKECRLNPVRGEGDAE
jgi:hypothetical protein